MGMFVLILFSARISGSHFNPIITFSYMIGNIKQGKFDRILGFLYMIAQFGGAFLGALFCTIINAGFENKGDIKQRASLSIEANYYIQTTLSEITGSFLMVFMYLCSTEEKTKFTKDSVVQTMILASSYLAAMMLAGSNVLYIRMSPVNPAIALGMQVTYSIGEGSSWVGLPIFLAGGFGGSLAAFLFFRFIYKTTAEAIKDIENEEAEADELAR
jgi:glycerol uptake facilitator-like aquaporin